MFKRFFFIILLAVALPLTAYAQTPSESDLITAYLKLNNITAQPGDWNICQDGGTGEIYICTWNTTDLGAQPSQDTLNTYATAATNIDNAANFPSIIGAGVTVACNSGDTICSSSLAGTYNIQSADLLQISLEAFSLTKSGAFSNGAASIDLNDQTGAPHIFTPAQFLEYATAVQGYYAAAVAARDTLSTGSTATYPTFPALTSVGSLSLPPNNSMMMTNSSGKQIFSTSLPSGTSIPWASLSGVPTTLSGYGISSVPWSSLTGKPTIPTAPLTGSVSITGGTLLLGGCLTTATVTITGAAVGNVVTATPSADPGVYVPNAWVDSPNTVKLRICAGIAETLATETWKINVSQP